MKTLTEKAGRRNRGLWDFAVALYARPGVASACLRLQNRHGVDVPLLLAAIWHAAAGRGVLDRRRCATWRAVARRWHRRAIGPLRAARNAIKADATRDPAVAALRKAILAAELEAERLCLAEIEALAAPRRPMARPRGNPAQRNAEMFVRGRTARATLTKIISALDGPTANQGADRGGTD